MDSNLDLHATSAAGKTVGKSKQDLPVLHQFTDYREYLSAYFAAKKKIAMTYTASHFARKAGLGKNSRGYLKLVIDGKRNLTLSTIRSFSVALELGPTDSLHFENLVLFNQAKDHEERKYYLDRLVTSTHPSKRAHWELDAAQVRVMSTWYSAAIRELVACKGFNPDPNWISIALKKKITPQQAKQTLSDLERVGLLTKDSTTGNYSQTTPQVVSKSEIFNPFLRLFHEGMIRRSIESLKDESIEQRHISGVTISINADRVDELKNLVSDFRKKLSDLFVDPKSAADQVVQVNFQVFNLSEPVQTDSNDETQRSNA